MKELVLGIGSLVILAWVGFIAIGLALGLSKTVWDIIKSVVGI